MVTGYPTKDGGLVDNNDILIDIRSKVPYKEYASIRAAKSKARGGSFGKTPTYAYNAETGETIALQLSSDGGATVVDIPDGFEVVGSYVNNQWKDMGGEFRNLYKDAQKDKLQGLPDNSYVKTLSPSDQLAYLEKKKAIETDATIYLNTVEAQTKLKEEKPKMKAALRGGRIAQATVAANLGDARKMIENGFSTTGFWGNQVGDLPINTDARTLRNKLEVVKANIAFAALKDMRDSSVSGSSGLGQLNKQEYDALQASWGAVDQATSKPELLQALADIESRINGYSDSSSTLYRDLYGEDYIYESSIRQDGGKTADSNLEAFGFSAEDQAELDALEKATNPSNRALPIATGQ